LKSASRVGVSLSDQQYVGAKESAEGKPRQLGGRAGPGAGQSPEALLFTRHMQDMQDAKRPLVDAIIWK